MASESREEKTASTCTAARSAGGRDGGASCGVVREGECEIEGEGLVGGGRRCGFWDRVSRPYFIFISILAP